MPPASATLSMRGVNKWQPRRPFQTASAGRCCGQQEGGPAMNDQPMTTTQPIVETATGRVRGAVIEGVAAFKTIPYGAPTSGTNRFMPPKPPVSWTGVRDTFDYTG